MKLKIVLSIMTLLIISALGAIVATLYIRSTTETLDRVIRFHQIEDLHRNLVQSIQTVQSGLYSPSTSPGNKHNLTADNIESMYQASRTCSNCHHDPDINAQIDYIQSHIVDYRNVLNSYLNAGTNAPRIGKLKLDAAAIGNEALVKTEGMFVRASSRLKSVTQDARQRIEWAWLILAGTMIATLVLGVMVAMNLINVITHPINTLVNATRMITSGNLGYIIDYHDKTEFGELASHFNAMSVSLKNGYAELKEEIAERKKEEEQHIYDAFHDALTGLPNRALFMDRLQHVITASQRRPGTPYYAVLFLDMDRFKTINDSLGHTIGDQLLAVVGRKMADCIRPGDTVARLGGDEFAILLENIGELARAVDVAQRIQKKLAAPLDVKGHEVFTSVSIGIAMATDRYERPEQVLRDADIAMYEAKGRGASSYEVFDAKMHANILDRLQLEADLRGAVDHKEFTLYYQPIIDLNMQRLTGFEALVRWKHPKRGLIYPMEFIPLAEETGLIYAIGEWILHEACRELKLLQVRYPVQPPLTMSINISSKQFTQQDLVSKLSGFLTETGVNPHTLALEITESMIMENVDAAIATMNQLRDMGIHLHIDDFGTGHSSLSYLHRFPVDALKIDRSFINKLSTDSANREIVTSIIALANSLHCDVIAEGVEMEHQLSKIQEMHCGYGQGFLFARPMAFNDIDVWMRGQKYPM
ncbi:MAG TPA: EAL domain-containing protein [Nitrospirota bacterium]|nr:EAL domain-containing protein [Nitrospirota bacterium]